MSIELKKINTEDANQWLEFQKEAFQPYLDEYQDYESNPAADTLDMILSSIETPSNHHYFAYSDGMIVGGIKIVGLEGSNEYAIGDMFVSPRFQNAGVGTKIVELAEALYPNATSWE